MKYDTDIYARQHAQTSDKFGCAPEKRTIPDLLKLGVINIDKPAGPTSHQVSAYLQKILHIKKSGHSGTLDPQVTGVLPIALQKGTKVIQTLLKAGKQYVCVMHLHKPVKEYDLYQALGAFTGEINQLPPIKSSVKRQWRKRTIYNMKVLEVVDQDVLFLVDCQAGTYIRKLCHDIGQHLGVGAHMAQLRRTRAGPFDESNLFTLQDVEDAWHYYQEGNETFIRQVIQPIEHAVVHLPKVWVLDTTVDSLCHGASLAVPGIAKVHAAIEPDMMVAVMTLKEELICYGRATLTSKKMVGEKGIAVMSDKVVMDPGVYPKMNRYK